MKKCFLINGNKRPVPFKASTAGDDLHGSPSMLRKVFFIGFETPRDTECIGSNLKIELIFMYVCTPKRENVERTGKVDYIYLCSNISTTLK